VSDEGERLNGWIDVSVTVRDGVPHWPGNPPIVLQRHMDIGRGDDCNLSRLAMGLHSGTHVDGPIHFRLGAAGVDDMPLTATTGEARIVEITDPHRVTVDELIQHQIRRHERILFRTNNSARSCWQTDAFIEDFVYISEPAAVHLAETGVQTVGIDYLSVGGYHADIASIHRILLDAGIWIIEGLDLSAVSAGRYELMCLPIKVQHSDGAPARAIVRPAPSPDGSPTRQLS